MQTQIDKEKCNLQARAPTMLLHYHNTANINRPLCIIIQQI